MMHKRSRNFSKQTQIIGKNELIAHLKFPNVDEILNTRFFKHSVLKIAQGLIQKKPINANSEETVDFDKLFELFDLGNSWGKINNCKKKFINKCQMMCLTLIAGYASDE